MIPHNRPTINERDIEAMCQVAKSGWVASGLVTKELENSLDEYLFKEKGHVKVVSSGTAALYIALKVLGINTGDEVIVPTYACVALLNAVSMAGAKYKLCDVTEEDFNIDVQLAKRLIGPKTKAIIINHTFGCPTKIELFKTLGILIIEDCAHALGSTVDDVPVGTIGDASIFSFYASKVITAGYGGAVSFKDPQNALKAEPYINYDTPGQYIQGFNFALSDINSAMALEQFKQLGSFLDRRRQIAEKYLNWASKAGVEFQHPKWDRVCTNHFRFVIRVPKIQVERIQNHLKSNDIATIIPIQQNELLHRYIGEKLEAFSQAEQISISSLSLPIYPTLNDAEFDKIIACLECVLC